MARSWRGSFSQGSLSDATVLRSAERSMPLYMHLPDLVSAAVSKCNAQLNRIGTMASPCCSEGAMYQHILVPLDGSAASQRGLREAISLAVIAKGRLHLLHVVNPYPTIVGVAAAGGVEAYRHSLVRAGEALLAEAHQTALKGRVHADEVVRQVMHEHVADAVLQEAELAGCDLIVIGSRGRRGVNRWMLGSDAERIVRSSKVPVLVVHDSAPPPR